MDHVALIASLPPGTRTRLAARSDAAGLRHLALHFGALTLTTAGLVVKVPLWPLLILPQGILLVFLFCLSHECTHRTPFRSRWLNELLGRAVAPILALPFLWFRYFHMAHHRYTNDPLHDPELQGGHPVTRAGWLIYLSGWSYWRNAARVLWTNTFGEVTAPYLPLRRRRDFRREAQLIFILYMLAAISLFHSPLLLWIWILPVLIGQPFLRAYLLAEHGLCPPVADMLENTRTTYTGRAIRMLAWNMPYHIEHHCLPEVPFHRLPELHGLTALHLKSTADGYAAFTADYVRSLER